MKVTLGNIRRTKLPKSYTDYIVLGVVTQVTSSFYNTPIILRSEQDLETYFDQNSSVYDELKGLVNTGVTLLVLNSFTDEKRFHSWLTPVSDGVVIPSYQTDSRPLKELKSPVDFDGETYIVRIHYNPSEVPGDGDFYINLPTGKYLRGIDNEFVSSLSFHTGELPEYVDYFNDVFDGVVSGKNLGEIFDDVQTYFRLGDTREGIADYITPYLSKDAVNDKENGIFTVYYNQPVRYLPKTIHPDNLNISFDYFDNIEFLQEHIPDGTVTFHSKLLGDCSNLRVSHSDGILTISLGDAYEEFEVSGEIDSGKYIGDVKSRLVEIKVNTESPQDIIIPEFSENFHPVVDLSNALIDLNGTISKILDSDYKVNAIVLSDSLANFDLTKLNTSLLDRELIFANINKSSNLNQLKNDYENVIKFSGTVDGLPAYIQFVSSLYNCSFSDELEGVPKLPEGIDLSVYDVWHPKSEELHNYLDSYELSSFIRDLGLPLSKITIYHLFYIMALSIFILRYRRNLLFVDPVATVAGLRMMITNFTSKFGVFYLSDIESSVIQDNNVSVVISTYLNSILKYKEIKLNFKLEF